jgi:hypothetical protein
MKPTPVDWDQPELSGYVRARSMHYMIRNVQPNPGCQACTFICEGMAEVLCRQAAFMSAHPGLASSPNLLEGECGVTAQVGDVDALHIPLAGLAAGNLHIHVCMQPQPIQASSSYYTSETDNTCYHGLLAVLVSATVLPS